MFQPTLMKTPSNQNLSSHSFITEPTNNNCVIIQCLFTCRLHCRATLETVPQRKTESATHSFLSQDVSYDVVRREEWLRDSMLLEALCPQSHSLLYCNTAVYRRSKHATYTSTSTLQPQQNLRREAAITILAFTFHSYTAKTWLYAIYYINILLTIYRLIITIFAFLS